MFDKREEKDVHFKLSKNAQRFLLFVVGAICICIAGVWQVGPLSYLLSVIGGALITAGIVDLTLTISTIKEYIAYAVNTSYDIATLVNLDIDILKKLREDVTSTILRKHFASETADDEFLNELSSSALDIVLMECYVKEYEVEIYFNFDDNYIFKREIKRIKYIKAGKSEAKINPISTVYMTNIPGKEIFKVNYCKVNGVPINTDINCMHVTDGSRGAYNVEYSNSSYYTMTGSEILVEYEVEMILPIDDIKSTIIMNKPCEKFKLDYFCETNNNKHVQLSGSVFCYEVRKKVKKYCNSWNHLQIRVDGSMLPGEGVAVYFQV